MKTKEELDALKKEVAALSAKLAELTDEELAQVAGGEVNDRTGEADERIERLQKQIGERKKLEYRNTPEAILDLLSQNKSPEEILEEILKKYE